MTDDTDIMRVIRENLKVRIRESHPSFYSSRSKSITVELYMGEDKTPFSSDVFSIVEGKSESGYY